tara:strand:- start:3031 stop:8121 length:5091 start_codon:yes stop_codon:yes gene_type:complete
MLYPENPNFEDEFEAEIKTKDQRFKELKSQLSENNNFKARLANKNLQIAPYIPSTIPAGMGLLGQDIEDVDPAVLKAVALQVQNQDKDLWDNITDKFKGVFRGTFAAFDAGLDFVKGQLLGRFPVEIGQRYSDKIAEGKSRTEALGEVFDEFDDIRKKVGDTAFTMAIREATRGREVNLGEGIIPQSTPINETDEYKELVKRGVAPEKALELAEQIVGKPITDIARQQAISGVQFRGETRAGLEQAGYTPEVTLGRLFAEPLVAMDVIEPGTKGYRNMSGSVDFVGTLALDPANWLLFGAGAAAKGAKTIKYVSEAQKAQSIAGKARTFVVSADGVANVQQLGAVKGGIRKTILERFPRLGGFSVEGFLQSKKGDDLLNFLSQSNDINAPAGNIDVLSSLLQTDDYATLGKISRSANKDEMYGLLNDFFSGRVGEKLPIQTKLFDSYKLGRGPNRASQMFNKLIDAPEDLKQFGRGPALRYSNQWSPLVRSFSKLYEPGFDPNNMNQSFVTLRNMMRQMDIDPKERAKILRDFVDDAEFGLIRSEGTELALRETPLARVGDELIEEATLIRPPSTFQDADTIFKANIAAVNAWKSKLSKEVGDNELAEKLIDNITRIYTKEIKESGLNFVDEQGQAFDIGNALKAYVNDEITDIPTFRLETELAQNYIPTIAPGLLVKATNIFKKDMLGRNPLKKFIAQGEISDNALELMMDKYISGIWKPAVLLRGAWTVRVIGEEQVRLWAQGYDGLFSPRRWVALATGKSLDPTGTLKILKKIDEGVSDRQIENLIFQEFPNLPKRFKYQGEQIGIVQAIRKYMNSGDRELLEIVNLTSKETDVMREFFEAINSTTRGWQGLRKTNPNMAAKGFAIFNKSLPDQRKGYINSMQTEFDQLMNDTLAVKILNEGPDAAKEFLWKTRFDENSIAFQISKQDEFFNSIFQNQDFSNKIVDFINARIHIKTGGKIDKTTLAVLIPGNSELRNILKTGKYKDINIKSMGTTKAARTQYTKIFNEFEDVLPASLKGRGGTQYGEFAFESRFGQKYDQLVENMFYYFMSVPTNKLSRGPVFKQAYWNKVTSLIAASDSSVKAGIIARAKQANVDSKLIKKMQQTQPASYEDALFRFRGTATDAGYANFDKAYNAIDEVSKAHALAETKNLLYDLSERTRFWEATRLIFPFGEAFQEIISTWVKILADNPAPARRFQLLVQKGRETNPFETEDTDRGFFYTDPTTGEEMFTFPGWGGLANKWLGIQEDDPIQLEASGFAKSVNLVGQSFLPGFGPLVQVPAAYMLKGVDPESDITKFVFGDFPPEPTTNPLDYFTRLIPYPSWLKKVIQAYNLDPDEYGRLQSNTTIDVYNALYYAGRVSDATYDEWKEGFDLAKEYAKTLTLIRAAAQFIGPTGFTPRWEVLGDTEQGRQVILVSALSQDYREKLEQNNGDQFKTTQEFIQQYGIDPTALFVGKSSQIYKRPVTVEGSKFYRDNKELFEEYKSTAYFAKPDDPTGEFSYEAYLKSIEEKAREPLTVEQWRLVRNNILGAIAWEQFMLSSAPGMKPYWLRSDDQAQADKTAKRLQLRGQYVGWGYDDIPGVASGATLDVIIQEFYRWKDNEILSESEAGKGLSLYLKARDNAKMESVRLGYGPESFRSARALGNIRLYLNDYANYVIEQYPDFQYIWNSYFKRELLEAERDEQIKQTIRNNY